MNETRFQTTITRFDAVNAQDPRGQELPYSRRLSAWVEQLAPAASEELRLAARAQHIGRWAIPRESYPMDRAGYLKWRTELKNFHAGKACEIMRETGYDEKSIARVQQLIQKQLFPNDPDSCVLEDALCLLFLEAQFAETTVKTGADKMIGILQKTWKKMTPQAREIALGLPMSGESRTLMEKALTGPAS